jgi:hypothetical protein
MNTQQTHPVTGPRAAAVSIWRFPAVWLSAVLIGYLFVNVARALLTPAAFAESFGVVLANPQDAAYLAVYALRTLFMALFGALLIARGELRWLARFLLLAVLIPLGDAAVVGVYGGAGVVRHLVIALVVFAVGLLMRRTAFGSP